MKKLIDLHESFGGDIYARLERRRTQGRWSVSVVLRYSVYTVPIGEVEPETAKQLNIPRNKVARCMAIIDANPNSPNYLNVLLNPQPLRTDQPRHSDPLPKSGQY